MVSKLNGATRLDLRANRGKPGFAPPPLTQLDLICQRSDPQDTIAARVTQNQIVENVRPVERSCDQMLDAPSRRRIGFRLEAHWLVTQPAFVAVAGPQTIDFADIRRSAHLPTIGRESFRTVARCAPLSIAAPGASPARPGTAPPLWPLPPLERKIGPHRRSNAPLLRARHPGLEPGPALSSLKEEQPQCRARAKRPRDHGPPGERPPPLDTRHPPDKFRPLELVQPFQPRPSPPEPEYSAHSQCGAPSNDPVCPPPRARMRSFTSGVMSPRSQLQRP